MIITNIPFNVAQINNNTYSAGRGIDTNQLFSMICTEEKELAGVSDEINYFTLIGFSNSMINEFYATKELLFSFGRMENIIHYKLPDEQLNAIKYYLEYKTLSTK